MKKNTYTHTHTHVMVVVGSPLTFFDSPITVYTVYTVYRVLLERAVSFLGILLSKAVEWGA